MKLVAIASIIPIMIRSISSMTAEDFGLVVRNDNSLDLSKIDRLAINADLLNDEESLRNLSKFISVIYVPVTPTTVVATVTKTVTDFVNSAANAHTTLPAAVHKEHNMMVTSIMSDLLAPPEITSGFVPERKGALDFIIGGNPSYEAPHKPDELIDTSLLPSIWTTTIEPSSEVIPVASSAPASTNLVTSTWASIPIITSTRVSGPGPDETDCETTTKFSSVSTATSSIPLTSNVESSAPWSSTFSYPALSSHEEVTTTSTIVETETETTGSTMSMTTEWSSQPTTWHTAFTSVPSASTMRNSSSTTKNPKYTNRTTSKRIKTAKATGTGVLPSRTAIPLYGNVSYTFPFDNETVSGYNPYMGLPTSPINFNGTSNSGPMAIQGAGIAIPAIVAVIIGATLF